MFDWKITTLPYFDFKTPSIILAKKIDDIADASNVIPAANTSVASANPEPNNRGDDPEGNQPIDPSNKTRVPYGDHIIGYGANRRLVADAIYTDPQSGITYITDSQGRITNA